MPYCTSCKNEIQPGAKFCPSCGATNRQLPERDLRHRPPSSNDWHSLEYVIYHRDSLIGAIGAVLLFFSAFLPWTSASISVLFFSTSIQEGLPASWLLAVAALIILVLLFRKGQAIAVLVVAVLVSAWLVLTSLMILSNSISPNIGMLLGVAGGGLTIYAGALGRQYDTGGEK